ncbi:MAG: Nramp family divalent metal transporter [Pseudomonadota bacterium]
MNSKRHRRFSLGPGLLVTAAFVGPGTIATASSAGANFGYSLAWALLFSVAATVILQEMSVRQAIVTKNGLAATMREALGRNVLGRGVLLLVVAAVGVGNAAYESGNIAGAALAISQLAEGKQALWATLIGVLAGCFLFAPAYRQLEVALIVLVLAMSAVFLSSAFVLGVDLPALIKGVTSPKLSSASATTVVALIGTTVVPYNLFLQANAARDRWEHETDRAQALRAARIDTFASIGLGGLVTLAIISSAAVSFFAQQMAFTNESFSRQLDPILGQSGRYFFAVGLFAAGLTSAVTAPLAAAYAVCGALGWNEQMQSTAFRSVALCVLITGVVFAVLGTRPLTLILFAQAANGLMLPAVVLTLLWLMNQRRFLGDAANRPLSNLLGFIVALVSLSIGLNKLWTALVS